MTNGYPFSLSSEEFKDKRILVTGGTKGVERAQPDLHDRAKNYSEPEHPLGARPRNISG